ncbi:MAG TPA: hypothetical protein VMD31_13810 [Opitutaceae bacterium]|nr:hypothetical protein [Opitutaceae bacterium]
MRTAPPAAPDGHIWLKLVPGPAFLAAGTLGDLPPEWHGLRRHASGLIKEAGRKVRESRKDVFDSLEKSFGK